MQKATSVVPPVGMLPVLIAAAFSAVLLWNEQSVTTGLILSLCLVALVAAASYWERRGIQANLDQLLAEHRAAELARPDIGPYTRSLHEVAEASISRWHKNVGISRLQTETAGIQLTKDFDTILSKLSDMLEHRGDQTGAGVVAAG